MIALGNNNLNNQKNTPVKGNKDENQLKEAYKLLENFKKKLNKNKIAKNDINNLFKSFGNNRDNIIKKLIEENNLIEIDGIYEIMF